MPETSNHDREKASNKDSIIKRLGLICVEIWRKRIKIKVSEKLPEAKKLYHPSWEELSEITQKEVKKLDEGKQKYINSSEFMVEEWNYKEFLRSYNEKAGRNFHHYVSEVDNIEEESENLKRSYLFMACLRHYDEIISSPYTIKEFASGHLEHEQVYTDDVLQKYRN